MHVRIISVTPCGATPATIDLVKAVAQEMSIDIDLEHIVVSNPREARQYRLIGSPTVQINGLDIEPEARNIGRFGMKSRRYGLSLTPSAELLRLAFINSIVG